MATSRDPRMEKSESIYANSEMFRDNSSDGSHGVYEDIYAYKNNRGAKTSEEPEKSGSKFYKVMTLCLGILSVLLLAALTGLCLKLTAERDQLQTKYTHLTAESDQLQKEKNELKKKVTYCAIDGEKMTVDFPEHKSWKAAVSEMELAPSADSEFCKFKPGDRVRVKASVKTPKYNWESVSHKSVGTIKGKSVLYQHVSHFYFLQNQGWTINMTASRETRMEMSENIYTNSGITADNRSDGSDGSYEDIYANEDNCGTRNTKESEKSVPVNNTAGSDCYKVTAVCLGLLSVLLVTAIAALCSKFIAERDQLQIKYYNMTVEKQQLEISSKDLRRDKDQLYHEVKQITDEKEKLQTSYNTMRVQQDQLQKENDGLLKRLTNCAIDGEKMTVDFPEQKSWNAAVPEMELAPSTDSAIDGEKMTVDFPEHKSWKAAVPEMELAPSTDSVLSNEPTSTTPQCCHQFEAQKEHANGKWI
ncbi:hypothetical protein NFI96_007113, partial [Prochilodus magdalenae]